MSRGSNTTEHKPDLAGYHKFVGTRPDFTHVGRSLAPGQIVKLDGDDAPDAEGNARLIEEGLLLPVEPEHVEDQKDAILDAVDRPTKKAAAQREARDEANHTTEETV